jgi:hypothetical protein
MHPENASYYAAPTGRLTLDDRLEASGRVCLQSAGVDSAVLVGWFNSRTFVGAPPANLLAVLVEGPSRVGHYFRPCYGTSDDLKEVKGEGPLIRPDGTAHEWTLRYEPGPDGGGHIVVTLDDAQVSLEVPAVARKGNAVFDRFGMVTWHRGGHFVEVYFDDVSYTK